MSEATLEWQISVESTLRNVLKPMPTLRTNFVCPFNGPVSIESLPREQAADLVHEANVRRTIRRNLRFHSPVSEAEIDLVSALLFYQAEGFELQHPVGRYDVDVYWLGELIAIEVDGREAHKRRAEQDRRRDLILRHEHGIRTHRIPASRVWQDPLWAARQCAEVIGETRRSRKA